MPIIKVGQLNKRYESIDISAVTAIYFKVKTGAAFDTSYRRENNK
jgi:hypothetical protein